LNDVMKLSSLHYSRKHPLDPLWSTAWSWSFEVLKLVWISRLSACEKYSTWVWRRYFQTASALLPDSAQPRRGIRLIDVSNFEYGNNVAAGGEKRGGVQWMTRDSVVILISQHVLKMMCMGCWRPSERQRSLMSCSFIGGHAGLWVYRFVFCGLLLDDSLDVGSVEGFSLDWC